MKHGERLFCDEKIHRDIAHLLLQLSESDSSEIKVIDQIKIKTNEILDQLNVLAICKTENKKMVSITDLKAKKYSPPLENFLFNLGVAENIMML
ncbi:hypothetical protein NQ314_014658 [Rhamnusium bicolor]|uniref:Uncharacterized protein n=1 Tax=Rhamnusium bicolor TaxID=1586634 RepID=A0AAV8X157_9CUCU|nr:hypothetical protein NQ314_014658 [Rhamnusium bicolor]